jgi:hypothetical protein
MFEQVEKKMTIQEESIEHNAKKEKEEKDNADDDEEDLRFYARFAKGVPKVGKIFSRVKKR